MPLPNTINSKPQFREMGKIKKGIVVVKGQKSYPKEVPYLVMDFDPEEAEVARIFHSYYGPEPTSIRIFAPFNDVDQWWDAWLRCFKGQRMIANAGLNLDLARANGFDPTSTIFFERLYSVEEKKWLVKRWARLDTGEPMVVNMNENIDPRNGEPLGPVIYQTDKKNKDGKVIGVTPYYLTATGTMKVMIKELIPFLGFLSLHTTGKVDVNNISGELAGLQLRADQAGIPITRMPMVLYRRREKVRDPDGNLTYHWNFHVGLDPEYSEKLAMIQQSQTDNYFMLEGPGSKGPMKELVEPQDVGEEYFDVLPDDLEPEVVDGEFEDEFEEDNSEVVISNFTDFWKYGTDLGLDMNLERDTIQNIWKDLKDDPARAVVALRKLAGKEG